MSEKEKKRLTLDRLEVAIFDSIIKEANDGEVRN